jgi:uncharacterized phiE125 gp8 family phage protein
MGLRLVTAADPVLSLAEAKAHLRVEHDDEDDYIEALVAAATGYLDGPTGILGRAIGSQQWDFVFDAFPVSEIRMPLRPLVTVDRIRHLDGAGAWQTLALTDYQVDPDTGGGWIAPAAAGWPTAMDTINAVEVRFTAGYAAVPPPILHAIRILVGHWYEHREPVVTGTIVAQLPLSVEALIAPYRVH